MRAALAFALASALAFAAPPPTRADAPTTYLTRESLEPDIWASLWLIDRVAGDGAEIVIANVRADEDVDGNATTVSFGYPGADLFTADGSHYALLVEALGVDDPALLRVGELAAGVEALGWRSSSDPDVARFEQAFRALQSLHGRYWVPLGCYKSFFDALHDDVSNGGALEEIAVPAPGAGCRELATASRAERARVREMAIEDLLTEIGSGADVVFVDTREPSEFAEGHVPGAISLPFRRVADADLERLKRADIVVPYCVKDFRGYEVARLMQRLGVEQVALMQPFGLAGWLSEGLPVADATRGSDAEALERLRACALEGCADAS